MPSQANSCLCPYALAGELMSLSLCPRRRTHIRVSMPSQANPCPCLNDLAGEVKLIDLLFILFAPRLLPDKCSSDPPVLYY